MDLFRYFSPLAFLDGTESKVFARIYGHKEQLTPLGLLHELKELLTRVTACLDTDFFQLAALGLACTGFICEQRGQLIVLEDRLAAIIEQIQTDIELTSPQVVKALNTCSLTQRTNWRRGVHLWMNLFLDRTEIGRAHV